MRCTAHADWSGSNLAPRRRSRRRYLRAGSEQSPPPSRAASLPTSPLHEPDALVVSALTSRIGGADWSCSGRFCVAVGDAVTSRPPN
jgi:hypothetical protein